ncbi:unnamed protein product, partial [Urochloa humidicola]
AGLVSPLDRASSLRRPTRTPPTPPSAPSSPPILPPPCPAPRRAKPDREEEAAEHLEECRTDWASSKPVVVLDVLWNLAFVAVLQCLLHVLCVTVKYRRRRRDTGQEGMGDWDFKLSIVTCLEPANTTFSFI